ncbi:MAG: biopolymer transporter ExbD [Candidatus Cloacimonadota bacterium]|nr:MAG: biopolymer transporter ExbD [Candidatus Cloacimonadota bacterium]
MRFAKKKEDTAGIPTGSMADIAFLLIFFFMVTTVFRAETGLDIKLPEAEEGHKLPSRGIAHIYVSAVGLISIDDNQMRVNQVSIEMAKKMQIDRSTIVSLRIDKSAKYDIVGDIFDQLSEAGALRVSLATDRLRG